MARLQAIRWEQCGHGGDHAALRTQWAAFMQATHAICEAHALGYQIGARCAAVLTLLPYPPATSPQELHRSLLHGRYPWRGSDHVALALAGYLSWENLAAEQRAAMAGAPPPDNPYLPFVQFLEAGGGFTTEHGMLDQLLPEGVMDAAPRDA